VLPPAPTPSAGVTLQSLVTPTLVLFRDGGMRGCRARLGIRARSAGDSSDSGLLRPQQAGVLYRSGSFGDWLQILLYVKHISVTVV